MNKNILAFGHACKIQTTHRYVVLGVQDQGAKPVVLGRVDSLEDAFGVRNKYTRLEEVGVFEVMSGEHIRDDFDVLVD
jgi:hypothetical protein